MVTVDNPIISKLKKSFFGRGGINALRTVVRVFRNLEVSESGCVTQRVFRDTLRDLSVQINPDVDEPFLFKALDTNRDGTVSVTHFLNHIIGGLGPRRTTVVQKVLASLDPESSGKIPLDRLEQRFVAQDNPLLRAWNTEDELKDHICRTFNSETNPDGFVTAEEFKGYCGGLSHVIRDDDFFEAALLYSWQADDCSRPRLDRTHRDWSKTRNGTDPLDLTQFSFTYHHESWSKSLYTNPLKVYDWSHMQRIHPKIEPNPSVLPVYVSTAHAEFPAYSSEEIIRSDPTREFLLKTSPTGHNVLDAVRERVLAKAAGYDGLHAVARVFRANLGKLRKDFVVREQFDDAMRAFGVKLTPLELDRIIAFVGEPKARRLTLQAFLNRIRGPISSERQRIIDAAFRTVTDREEVSLSVLKERYNATAHPAVLSYNKTKEEVLDAFVEDWEMPGLNSAVTRDKWNEFFGDISCVAHTDAEFEVLMRDMWHICRPLVQ